LGSKVRTLLKIQFLREILTPYLIGHRRVNSKMMNEGILTKLKLLLALPALLSSVTFEEKDKTDRYYTLKEILYSILFIGNFN
jgi:hypothetical protein